MPRKPMTPCSQPGCPELTHGGRCADHASQADRQRGTARERGYATTRWQRIRKRFIYDHPWCVLCGAAAKVADHFPVSRKDLLAQGVADPDATKHLRPLCVRCHSVETAKHQPGGWAFEARAKRMMREDPPPF